MNKAVRAGVRGRRDREAVIEMASGRECCEGRSRQGRVPVRLFGAMVRAMAYERRR